MSDMALGAMLFFAGQLIAVALLLWSGAITYTRKKFRAGGDE